MTAPEIAERMVWDAWNSPAYCISVDSTHYMAASVFTWISSLESCSWPVFQGSVTGSNLARECLTWRKHCQQITEARELLYLNRTIRRRRRSESEEIDFLPGPRDRSAEAGISAARRRPFLPQNAPARRFFVVHRCEPDLGVLGIPYCIYRIQVDWRYPNGRVSLNGFPF